MLCHCASRELLGLLRGRGLVALRGVHYFRGQCHLVETEDSGQLSCIEAGRRQQLDIPLAIIQWIGFKVW